MPLGGTDGQVGPPPVLVHAGTGVPRGLQKLGTVPALKMDDRGPAAFLRTGLLPPHVAVVHEGETEAQPGAGDVGGGNGRGPGAVGKGRTSGHMRIVPHTGIPWGHDGAVDLGKIQPVHKGRARACGDDGTAVPKTDIVRGLNTL
nr:hypothetical protein GCM10010200_070090 [Actinomadura rugatobispora]